jgi:hypothetical protein
MKSIFVFGSNLSGRHGAGSALEARLHWGAPLNVHLPKSFQDVLDSAVKGGI